LIAPAHAQAVSLIAATDNKCTDLVNSPKDFYSYDPGTITWKMDDQFLDAFPHPSQQNQVRLAFKEWETASTSTGRRSPLAPYGFARFNGNKPFSDLRSVVVHELGHVLGAQHPDACWFNNSMNDNYKPDGQGGWVASAPSGGEIMNEGNGPGLPTTKPDKGLRPGEYWRVVSKDELRMMDHAYGEPLHFVEVSGDEPADITLEMNNVGGSPSNNLGVGGPDTFESRVPGDLSQGRRTLTGSLALNASTSNPITFSSRKSAWEFTTQTGKPVTEISLGVWGTDNRTPVSVSSTGAHRFTQLKPVITTSPFLPERLGRFLTHPSGGSIPNGSTVQVGLEEDVWDWTLKSSSVKAADGSIFPSNLVTVFGFGLGATAASGAASGPDQVADSGLESAPTTPSVTGFRVQSADSAVTVNEVVMAIPPENLRLDSLNSSTVQDLRAAGKAFPLKIEPLRLGPGEEFWFVLGGNARQLPADVIRKGNFRHLQRPELADRQLLVSATAGGEGSSVRAFSLINDGAFDFQQVEVDTTPSDREDRVGCGRDTAVQVAILGSGGFDSSKVDPATVAVGVKEPELGTSSVPQHRLVDVDGDGDRDLVLNLPATLDCAGDRLTVSGETVDGLRFVGSQAVLMVR
jgi:hypothetical protein